MAGYDDTNDAKCLCVDSAMRHVEGGRAIACSAASTSAMGRFETEILTLGNVRSLIQKPHLHIQAPKEKGYEEIYNQFSLIDDSIRGGLNVWNRHS